jgi:hypothetical protein
LFSDFVERCINMFVEKCNLNRSRVTRLKCGCFILSLNWNHVISDATGLKQFMNAIHNTLKITPKFSNGEKNHHEKVNREDPNSYYLVIQ